MRGQGGGNAAAVAAAATATSGLTSSSASTSAGGGGSSGLSTLSVREAAARRSDAVLMQPLASFSPPLGDEGVYEICALYRFVSLHFHFHFL